MVIFAAILFLLSLIAIPFLVKCRKTTRSKPLNTVAIIVCVIVAVATLGYIGLAALVLNAIA